MSEIIDGQVPITVTVELTAQVAEHNLPHLMQLVEEFAAASGKLAVQSIVHIDTSSEAGQIAPAEQMEPQSQDGMLVDVGCTEQDLQMLGGYIRRVRQECGLTQAEFADKLERSPALISLIEKGTRRPSIETLVTLAEEYGLNSTELLRRAGYVVIDPSALGSS